MIVVGLGAMGAATCLHLARRGLRVTGIDRFAPPHVHGSSHGETRITRLAIGEGLEYVPLALRSHELWRELEAESGEELLVQCGGLIVGPRGSDFVATTQAAARRFGIAHEDLSAEQLAAWFPMLALGEGAEGYFEPAAGYVRPEAAVRVQLELARRAGAELFIGTEVRSWRGNEIVTSEGTRQADHIVLCPGAGIVDLVPEARHHARVHPQLLHWFPIRRGYEELRDMPVFVWAFAGERDEYVHGLGFYGFPAIDGPGGGVKLATEVYEEMTTPAAVAEFVRLYVAPCLPWLGDEPLRSVPCLYTSRPGSRFLIDRAEDRVTVVSACSGHGFKHSAAIGEAVADWVAGGERPPVLAPFAFA